MYHVCFTVYNVNIKYPGDLSSFVLSFEEIENDATVTPLYRF
jgi:hypothetical protein